jgi:predicted methyltransferase
MKSGWLAATLAVALAVACGEKPATDTGAETGAKPAQGSLEWSVAGRWRIDAERARDPHRHPAETLAFFGVKPGDTVVELWPGSGYFTAILGPYLKEGGGRLYAAQPDPSASPSTRTAIEAYTQAFVAKPDTFGAIEVTIASRDSPGIAPDGSADVVLTFRNIHNWMAAGYADKVLVDAFRVLKPGGVFGVEEHRLPSARDQDLTAPSGYVREDYVIQLAQNAGFVLEASSELNANPKDTADHAGGVWMLPPTLRPPQPGTPAAEGYDRARYQAIGESDRMTLRFRKPDAPQLRGPTEAAPAQPAIQQ